MNLINNSVKTNWKFIGIVVILAFLVGGWALNVFFEKQSRDFTVIMKQHDGEIVRIKEQIAKLENRLDSLENFLSPINRRGTTPLSFPLADTKSLELLVPSNMRFCMGDEYIIRWKASGFVQEDTVWIFVLRPGGGSMNLDVRTIYANQNETGEIGKGLYIWKVGEWAVGSPSSYGILQEGVYKIHIFDPENPSVEDVSDPITLIRCEG